jgi:hypothetical protein
VKVSITASLYGKGTRNALSAKRLLRTCLVISYLYGIFLYVVWMPGRDWMHQLPWQLIVAGLGLVAVGAIYVPLKLKQGPLNIKREEYMQAPRTDESSSLASGAPREEGDARRP